MPHRILHWIVFFVSISALAVEPELSAARRSDQSWKEAINQNMIRQKAPVVAANALAVSEIEPRGVEGLPEWTGNMATLKNLLFEAEGFRHYENPNSGDFQRKAAWLYVNDGCFSKAAHVSFVAKNKGLPQPGKIYAFGDLSFNSPYAVNGKTAYWSYHVAAAYSMGSIVYVLDPAVSPQRLLTSDEWKALISPNPLELRMSYCDSKSYSPLSRCRGGNGNGAYIGSMPQYLRLEWSNLNDLGYSPRELLAP
jgi:hypothetical protein